MKVAKQIADNHVKIMAICPGRVDTKMIKDIVKKGYNPSNRNLINPEEVAKKIYNMIFNQLCYHNGQIIEFIINEW